MNTNTIKSFCRRAIMFVGVTACVVLAVFAVLFLFKQQILLGPPDPGAELGDQWYSGTNGAAYRFVDNTDPNSGNNDFTLGNEIAGKENLADWRSPNFALGPAAAGNAPIKFSFSYKLPDAVNVGDNVRVELRFFDKTGTNYLDERKILVGSSSRDASMSRYKRMVITNIRASRGAATADIRVNANLFEPWSSGTGRFDDFAVTTIKHSLLFKAGVAATALIGICALIMLLVCFWRRSATEPAASGRGSTLDRLV
jgi:hypothetical protein